VTCVAWLGSVTDRTGSRGMSRVSRRISNAGNKYDQFQFTRSLRVTSRSGILWSRGMSREASRTLAISMISAVSVYEESTCYVTSRSGILKYCTQGTTDIHYLQ
jgi:hypothetical protein